MEALTKNVTKSIKTFVREATRLLNRDMMIDELVRELDCSAGTPR